MTQTLLKRAILCVIPEQDNADLLAAMLGEYELTFVPNALEAIRTLNAGRVFDAYVVDYWLPDWTGPALCRDIRATDDYGPILVCSGAAAQRDRDRAVRAGASAYLVKPIEPTELRGKLRSLLALTDLESLRAKLAEELAIDEEIQRRLEVARESMARATLLQNKALERVARIKAYQAFVEHHGTRAHFERWWPQMFDSARANTR